MQATKKETINDILEQETKNYNYLNKDTIKLIFDLVTLKLRVKLANLNEQDKKEAQTILATGDLKVRPEIFRFINEHQRLLQMMFPIWLGNPENVARNLPLEKNIFDYGIYDEASQVYLEKIYSIVYRTNIKVVAGDDKQIQPTSYFSSIQEYDMDGPYEFNYTTNVAKSLLEKAKALS